MFMCVNKKKFLELCDLFPNTKENLKRRSLERRLTFLQAMQSFDMKSPLKALRRGFNNKIDKGKSEMGYIEGLSPE
jgi:hypothetical protein